MVTVFNISEVNKHLLPLVMLNTKARQLKYSNFIIELSKLCQSIIFRGFFSWLEMVKTRWSASHLRLLLWYKYRQWRIQELCKTKKLLLVRPCVLRKGLSWERLVRWPQNDHRQPNVMVACLRAVGAGKALYI